MDTRKYPIVFFDTLTRPATRYFVQYPTRPNPILKNPTRWALLLPHPLDRNRFFWISQVPSLDKGVGNPMFGPGPYLLTKLD